MLSFHIIYLYALKIANNYMNTKEEPQTQTQGGNVCVCRSTDHTLHKNIRK